MAYTSQRCRACSGPGDTKHGWSKTTEYQSWLNMKARCYKPSTKEWGIYGGRGIAVCDRWRDSFPNFLADLGPKPTPKHSIDRINSDGNYEPSNCRWASTVVQASNTSRNVPITYQGRTQTYTAWARELGMNNETLRNRLVKGWDIERALTTPVRVR